MHFAYTSQILLSLFHFEKENPHNIESSFKISQSIIRVYVWRQSAIPKYIIYKWPMYS